MVDFLFRALALVLYAYLIALYAGWLFSTSVDGANASASLYGLIETAKANSIEPYAYLKRVFTQIPNIKDYDDVDQLLPFNVKNVTR